ncbi:MAG: hypothetical protein ABNH49_07505 [Hyphomonas sp.]|uniref:hypothetical protein n=1 Tax=Hyphomonas sp. TaxID=87 RepID=UPI00262A8616|nr:hypothetical protein [Hyphomonas sp.]MDF1804990.1 hypothetical protein [Hyphomonas sp.]
MANEAQVTELQEYVAEISKIDVAGTLAKADWDSMNFNDCADDLRTIISMVKPLGSLPVRLLPNRHIGEIIGKLKSFTGIVKQIEAFTLADNASSNRESLAAQLKGQVEQIYSVLAPHAAYLALYAGDMDRTIQSLEELRTRTSDEVEEFKLNLSKSKEEIGSILISAREAAGAAGVGAFSSDFEETANEQDKEAKLWLGAAAALGTASIVAAVASYFLPIAADATAAQIVQLTTSKIVVLGLLLSTTYWSGRQFRALRHQISVNRHRANSLKTFQAFVKAAADDGTRDAVLMETTRSIFAITSSGYLGNQGEPSGQDGLKIVEMIRGASSGE